MEAGELIQAALEDPDLEPRRRREISSLLAPAARATREFGSVVPFAGTLDSAAGIWSLSPKPGRFCGLPLVPMATTGMGARVLEVPRGVRCWGWTPPGELEAANRYGRELIADVELRSTNKTRPDAGWTGRELAEAEAVARRVGGVTSHGFVLRQLRNVLGTFARAGCAAYPQVYDSDRSTEPRSFLRQCVSQYRAAGFAEVRPLLGVVAGPEHLFAWLQECHALGVRPDLWQLPRLREMATCDNADNPQPAPQPAPVPFPRPAPQPPISLNSPSDVGSLALLLLAAGFLYSVARRE